MDMFINLKGVRRAMLGNMGDLLASGNEGNNDNTDGRKFVPASIWWTIWKEVNSRCFKHAICSLHKPTVYFLLGFGANLKYIVMCNLINIRILVRRLGML